MWPWEPGLEDSWQCVVAIFSLVVELSDRAQPGPQFSTLKVHPSSISRNPRNTNLYKWCRFPRGRFLTQGVFSRSPLETRIKTLPLEIQKIIVTKVWQNRTVHTFVKEIQNYSNFLENDYMLSQYLEHVLLAPQGEQLIEDACEALKRIENVALGIYTT